MKHLYLLILTPTILLFSCGGAEEAESEEHNDTEEAIVEVDTIPELPITIIEDCRENPCEAVDLSTKAKGDVLVRRESGHWGEGYRCFYYHDMTDSLREHAGILMTDDDYDKATYEWVDDTTITFVLQNSETGDEYEMQLFGNGGTNGMIVPDAEEEVADDQE